MAYPKNNKITGRKAFCYISFIFFDKMVLSVLKFEYSLKTENL